MELKTKKFRWRGRLRSTALKIDGSQPRAIGRFGTASGINDIHQPAAILANKWRDLPTARLAFLAWKVMRKMHGENSLKLTLAGDTFSGSFDLRLSRFAGFARRSGWQVRNDFV
jgi:hypothetical protein